MAGAVESDRSGKGEEVEGREGTGKGGEGEERLEGRGQKTGRGGPPLYTLSLPFRQTYQLQAHQARVLSSPARPAPTLLFTSFQEG